MVLVGSPVLSAKGPALVLLTVAGNVVNLLVLDDPSPLVIQGLLGIENTTRPRT